MFPRFVVRLLQQYLVANFAVFQQRLDSSLFSLVSSRLCSSLGALLLVACLCVCVCVWLLLWLRLQICPVRAEFIDGSTAKPLAKHNCSRSSSSSSNYKMRIHILAGMLLLLLSLPLSLLPLSVVRCCQLWYLFVSLSALPAAHLALVLLLPHGTDNIGHKPIVSNIINMIIISILWLIICILIALQSAV